VPYIGVSVIYIHLVVYLGESKMSFTLQARSGDVQVEVEKTTANYVLDVLLALCLLATAVDFSSCAIPSTVTVTLSATPASV